MSNWFMWSGIVMVLGVTTKCGHFPKLYATNCHLEKWKSNKLTLNQYYSQLSIVKIQIVMEITVYKEIVKISIWMCGNLLSEDLSTVVV